MNKKEFIKNILNSELSEEKINFLLTFKDFDILNALVKKIGQLSDNKYAKILKKIIKHSDYSLLRREAVSSIGRIRDKKNNNFLLSLLNDHDPNVVLQAIRGLLIFKQDKYILNKLLSLKKHENELVRKIINQELLIKEESNNEYDNESYCLYEGDSLNILKKMKKNIVDLTFTSPPYYNARDYSIYNSYNQYLKILESIFKQVFRVTKHGHYLIVNTSPIMMPRFSRNHSSTRYPIPFDLNYLLIKMGWEFVDDIVWKKPEPSVMNRNGTFQKGKKPLTYKPNLVTEYILVYKKPSILLTEDIINKVSLDNQKNSLIKESIFSTNIWEISPVSDKIHLAPFPKKLSDLIIKLYSYKNDLILDPFAGIGTVGHSCIELERKSILIEKESKYVQEILKRHPIFNKRNNY